MDLFSRIMLFAVCSGFNNNWFLVEMVFPRT